MILLVAVIFFEGQAKSFISKHSQFVRRFFRCRNHRSLPRDDGSDNQESVVPVFVVINKSDEK